MVGICKDELNRIKDDPKIIYPMRDYTRDGCAWLIGKAGLPMPHKTGCWFCYALKKQEWINLYNNRRDLWDKCVALENNAKANYKNIPLEEQIKKWTRI